MQTRRSKTVLSISRLLIAIVLLSNLLAAFAFLFKPGEYTAAYELYGTPGELAVAGVGLLFLMWQVPYGFALSHPVRHRVSLIEACLMQALGLIGESFFVFKLPAGHALLKTSLTRFIVFDLAGLIFLILALWLSRSKAET